MSHSTSPRQPFICLNVLQRLPQEIFLIKNPSGLLVVIELVALFEVFFARGSSITLISMQSKQNLISILAWT